MLLKETKHYCDGNPVTDDLASQIAKAIFGGQPAEIKLVTYPNKADAGKSLADFDGQGIKGLELLMIYSGNWKKNVNLSQANNTGLE